ncbi:hypothetical protein NDU88_001342 [Pleurodeles waltl]|uniref:Uncharacterized protein n=1 Tax=Pleurodeles waltl TaxID=8319 RepID=A0AAV7NAH7_PLEWA|nr:hypothetical protein NDU88_001342 [Pleurodeles waltl]
MPGPSAPRLRHRSGPTAGTRSQPKPRLLHQKFRQTTPPAVVERTRVTQSPSCDIIWASVVSPNKEGAERMAETSLSSKNRPSAMKAFEETKPGTDETETTS